MPPKCLKCSRPTRGHSGPINDECTMTARSDNPAEPRYNDSPGSDSEDADKSQDNPPSGSNPKPPATKKTPAKKGKSDTAFALREVLHQLGNLSASVQKLNEETSVLTRNQTQFEADMTAIKMAATAANTGPQLPVLPAYAANPADHDPAHVPAAHQGAGLPLVPLQEQPVPLPNGARINRKTLAAARTGEFINLSEFTPNTEPSAIMESSLDDMTGQVIFKPKNLKKTIDNFLTWSRAWAGYEGLLITMNIALYQQLSDYRLFVQGCDAIYHWAAVSSYDQRHRHKLSLTHSFDFNICNTEIYVCTLNASSIRPNPKACFSCGSLDHHLKDCPFQRQGTSKNNSTQRKSLNYPSQQPKPNPNFVPRSDSQAYGESKQVLCFNWNNGRCSNPACWRLHACSGCGGPDPRTTCPRCTNKG